jgi:glycosyltransferase involved in cell wall biosynthesis
MGTEIKNKLSIIVPVYNEENTIEEVIKELLSLKLNNNFEKEIIIVND